MLNSPHYRIPLIGMLVALVAALTLTGCGNDETVTNTSAATTGAVSYPATVRADNGEVAIPAKPNRIISLSPTATEDLFAIGAGSQVVAVDKYSNFPAEAPATDLDGLNPNVEAMVKHYTPDLVVVSYDANGMVGQLAELKVPTLTLGTPNSLQGAYDQILTLGRATDHQDQAATVVNDTRVTIDRIAASVKNISTQAKLKVFLETDTNYFTAGRNSFAGELLNVMGLENIAGNADTTYPQLSSEAVIKANPHLILLTDGQTPTQVSRRPGWSTIDAVSKGGSGIVPLDKDVASRWGPRLDEFAQMIAGGIAAYQAVHGGQVPNLATPGGPGDPAGPAVEVPAPVGAAK